MIGGAKGIGLGIDLGLVNQYNRTGSQSYIEPEVLDSLVGVWSAYGMTNDSPNRSTIKNKLSNKGGDFVISNAAFKLNSGFGKYEVDFTSWIQTNGVIASSDKVQNSIIGRFLYFNTVNKKEDVPSFKVNITLGQQGKLQYNYIKEDGTSTYIVYSESGIYTIPASYFSKYTGGNAWFGFYQIEGTSIIEQIPSLEGAFVTDGIDDLITSTKTVSEMGVTNEITIISMIHQIKLHPTTTSVTNDIRVSSSDGSLSNGRNAISAEDKTGIYGWSRKDRTISVVNNILGDKNDYTAAGEVITNYNNKFSVVGTADNRYTSSVAWYWTIIANKVLTTDQINQVIAYFNLDRTLNPDILCNTIKQGITNENHEEFGDKLIDFSGNGRDIQLNNIAWKGDSGIGKYNFSNISIIANRFEGTVTTNKCHFTKKLTNTTNNFCDLVVISPNEPIKFKVSGLSDGRKLFVANKSGSGSNYNFDNGEHEVSLSFAEGVGQNNPFGVTGDIGDIDVTVEFIPSHAGALCLDGVNDFGKVTGMPIYKDYTVVADYERLKLNIGVDSDSSILSKSESTTLGAFMFNTISINGDKVSYSFGRRNIINADDTIRKIFYQSKYINDGQDINAGSTFVDSDKLWLGSYRDSDHRFFNGAIYSLMSFPYSMSEFLIERQLKKHKLGTLYPDMVEFRPVINSNIDIKKINYWDKDWNILHIGDYVSIGNDIKTNITVPNGYKISKVTSNAFDNITIEKSSTEFIYEVKFYGIKKSPQKIGITIEQDENYVLFNPVINSNYDNYKLTFHLREYEKLINIGDYIPKGTYIRANLYLKNNIDELVTFTFNGVNIDYAKSPVLDTAYNIRQIYNYDSPQEVNITIDEYIRYEDIKQPYPLLFEFTDENGNLISWGGKAKVGNTITRTKSVSNANILAGLYNTNNYKLNGKLLEGNSYVVEKQMVFTCTATYLLDDNEPKCILSPRLLRIPNSSYKILGYIPDISGHGNHGVIHNSAYSGESGANGYLQNFSGWTKASGVSSTDSVISSSNNLVAANGWIAYVTSGNVIPTFKVEISGIPVNGNLRFEGSDQVLVNGVNTIQGLTTTKVSGFYISNGYDNDWSNLRIEQIGEYEGAYCLDGVDDFVTIPTIAGKQVLIKLNWQNKAIGNLIYDQRDNGSTTSFAIMPVNINDSTNNKIAYQTRNANGITYIDGIRNEYIESYNLENIIHNITITNPDVSNKTVALGASNRATADYFAKYALYDFMLFDDISTDDKIKELNEYMGIEAKVELPPYYWDAYGKTNLDADKATIQQRGVAVGDYDLTNTNFAYDKMSGFGGYEFEKFTDTTKWIETKREDGIEVIEKNDYSFTAKKVGTGQYFGDFKNNSIKTLDRDLTVKAISNNNVYIRWEFKYRTAKKPDIDSAIILLRQAMTPNVPITVTLPYKTQEEQTELGVVEGSAYYLFYFDPSDIPVGDEYTVEMLPLYTNGLVYDGITDYSKNANIPALDDFTAIIKREWLKKQGCPLIKGSKVYEGGNGNALLLEWDKAYNFVFYKRTDIMEGELPDNISFITPTNYNGNVITRGSEQDTNGICIAGDGNAGFANMVFYKLILYPKTIPLLQINFLKNLMERDEIIDLNNPIFIQE